VNLLRPAVVTRLVRRMLFHGSSRSVTGPVQSVGFVLLGDRHLRLVTVTDIVLRRLYLAVLIIL